MLLLNDRVSVSRALADPELELDLRALIDLRARQLMNSGGDVRFVVVQGGDTPDVINSAVGFPITGDHAEPLSPDWIHDHGLWFEIAYGARGHELVRIFVENGPGTELGINYLCLSHFWPEGDEEEGPDIEFGFHFRCQGHLGRRVGDQSNA